MNLTRRQFHRSILALCTATTLMPVFSVTAEELLEGRDWRKIDPPQPSDTKDKIEVLEFFSYGCPHCAELNRLLKPWAQKLPSNVVLRRLPVTFGRGAWVNLAKLYFALDSTAQLEQFDQLVFDALHHQRVKLFTAAAMTEWLSKQGANVNTFAAAFESFDVQMRLNRSEALTSRYEINAVPTMIVGGRYVVLGNAAKTQEDLLKIADALIKKVQLETTIQ